MVSDALEDAAKSDARSRDRWIGVYIGFLAVALAICAMGGANAAKEANHSNIEATNIWGFFQAKNMRRHVLRLQVDELELQLASGTVTQPLRTAIETKIAAYQALDKQLTSDPESNEGLDELFHRGKALEEARDVAASRDPYFDWGEALLQIAIVLAGVAIISSGTMLIVLSALVGAVGLAMTLNGFTLLVQLPFIA
ncbi:DUF4337 domain-containing protein [Hyphomicrobium sp.]|uniref:DUF4337 domain-containing protein n=1 Tax=Hyphomicrobium sp. TaxID=82 RepID=UPI002BC5CFE5|nr:DUF4337 domain-containing protein [Hyphomicrobium sp.]HRN88145.1 DUF4337 domain-containing protein [Hyphomicrobium sp.]HRQ26490.1 DUF4337 domain-containing protein [Hyphomicrobium sp.]